MRLTFKLLSISLLLSFLVAPLSLAESTTPVEREVDVARAVPNLPGAALKTLNQADALLNLSNQQFNALLSVLEARTAEWVALMKNKKSMESESFEAEKRRIFGEYAKQMLVIFTPEQQILWRNR
jgi:sensor histidine kinase YesM